VDPQEKKSHSNFESDVRHICSRIPKNHRPMVMVSCLLWHKISAIRISSVFANKQHWIHLTY